MTELYMLYRQYPIIESDLGEQFIGIYSSLENLFKEALTFKEHDCFLNADEGIFYFYSDIIIVDKPKFTILYEDYQDYDHWKTQKHYYKSNDAIFNVKDDTFVFGNYSKEEKEIQNDLLYIINKITPILKIRSTNKYMELFGSLIQKYRLNNEHHVKIANDLTNKSYTIRDMRQYKIGRCKIKLDCYNEFYESCKYVQ
jgi:hypothetical protein